MNLLILAVLSAVCGAAKLDRTYLPPASARTAGGSPGSLQAPNSFSQDSAPKGSYTNDFQGVVVDAALAGTRASGSEETGLGAPRNSYGSTASKVGEAAFRGAQAGFRFPVSTQDDFSSGSDHSNQFGEAREIPDRSQGFGVSRDSNQGFEVDSRPERPQAAQERAASTLKFDSEVGVESFNYAFETDNGISAEETGTATNGVQAQGGYSYTGDDGKVYTVTYTADEGGYQPRGDHLPTPPPIPEEILKSLEQNAKDEANGVIDDGLYDAQKYNAGDYAESDSANGKQNGRPSVNTGNDVHASGTFINQNNLPFNPNNPRQRGDDKAVSQFQASNNGIKSNAAGNRFGASNEYLPPFQKNRPQNSRQQVSTANAESADVDSSSTFQQQSIEGSGDFHSHSQQNQHASRPSSPFGSRPSSDNQFNSFKQSSSNGNQFNQNGNRFPSSQSNRQQTGSPVSSPSNNGRNQFSAQDSASLSSQHSTSIPDTELTTPFESSPDTRPSMPSTNTFGLNAQAPHNGQSHLGLQNSHHQTSLASAQPTIPSFPQSRPQSSNNNNNHLFGGNRNNQPAFSTQAPRHQEKIAQQPAFGQQTFGTKKPQFSQNTDSQFAPSTQTPQFAPSTQTPQFAQQSAFGQQSFGTKQPQYSQNQYSQNADNQFAPSTQKPQFSQQSSFGQQTFKQPQFPQNQISQNTDNQFAPSTQKPKFAQQPTAQDDSYYYNQPSRTFNTPQSQGSRFPSAASHQFDRVTQRPFSSQTTPHPDEENYPSTVFKSQNGQRQGSSRYPRPPSFPTESSASDNQFQSNAIASATNGITQASAFSFTAPTSATGFNRQQSSHSRQQFQQPLFQPNRPSSPEPSKPSFVAQTTAHSQSSRGQSQVEKQNFESAQPLSQQPLQDVKQPKLDDDTKSDAIVMNQQYNGEIYDYTKPAEMLPPPENGFGQFGTKMPSSQKPAQARPQFGQTSAQQVTSKPFATQPTQFSQSSKGPQSQFGSRPQFTQTTAHSQQSGSPFGSKAQYGQTGKAEGDQFGAQTQESTDADVEPARQQFNQASEQQNQFNNQRRPFTQTQGNIAAADTPMAFGHNGRTCCTPGQMGQQTSFGARPSQFGGDSSFDSTFQSTSAFKPDKSQSVAGKGEVFGGPRAPPSFDETGYHY